MKLFEAIKLAQFLRIGHAVVIDVEELSGEPPAIGLSYPDRMGISTMLLEDQDILLSNGRAQVRTSEGDTFTLEFLLAQPLTTTIFEKEYHGFEDASDIFRDVSEAFDGRFNPAMKDIPGEFQGTMRVTITYTPEDDPTL